MTKSPLKREQKQSKRPLQRRSRLLNENNSDYFLNSLGDTPYLFLKLVEK
jgi:hypothetical protein